MLLLGAVQVAPVEGPAPSSLLLPLCRDPSLPRLSPEGIQMPGVKSPGRGELADIQTWPESLVPNPKPPGPVVWVRRAHRARVEGRGREP